MRCIAHRGASGHQPEHTLAAYDLALAQGAHMLELDVRRTRDGEAVVVHDETADRTLPGISGRVADLTLAELRAGPAPLLTLADVVARYGGRTGLLVELKPGPRALELERRVVAELDAHGLLDPEAGVIVQSFDVGCVKRLGDRAPELPRHQLLDVVASAQSAWLVPGIAAYATGVAAWHGAVDAALVDAARAAGLAVHGYTANDPRDVARLAAAGADGVITDVPDVALAALAEPLAA